MSRGARSHGPSGPWAAAPPSPVSSRPPRNGVGAFAPRGRVAPASPGPVGPGSRRLPRWDAGDAVSRPSRSRRGGGPRRPEVGDNRARSPRLPGCETFRGGDGPWNWASPATLRSGRSADPVARVDGSPGGPVREWDGAWSYLVGNLPWNRPHTAPMSRRDQTSCRN